MRDRTPVAGYGRSLESDAQPRDFVTGIRIGSLFCEREL